MYIDDVVDCIVGNVDLIEEYIIYVCVDVIVVCWFRIVWLCSGEFVEVIYIAIFRLLVESRIGDVIDIEIVWWSFVVFDGLNGDFYYVDNRYC